VSTGMHPITLSASVMSPTVVKNGRPTGRDCVLNATKSRKIAYCATVKEVEKSYEIRVRVESPQKLISSSD